MINVRQKGADGEREVARALNAIISSVLRDYGVPLPNEPIAQRNQNQTAVGGSDFCNVFGLSIEVKRQQQLSVNTWWLQCTLDAERNKEFPILLYRQNHKPWRCVMLVQLMLPPMQGAANSSHYSRAEISWEDFKVWFEEWVMRKVAHGEQVRT